ncbi:MAG TPA: DUF1232 domain-containing protein [Limnobacter sp.]|nr:DUF1232 domain-containing protein [Limnobacter sp.]
MLSRFFPVLGKLKALKTHGRLMLHAFRHADTPKWIKGVMLGVVVYLFSPIDMVPDVLVLFGITDDLVVITAAMWFLGKVIPEQVKNSLPMPPTTENAPTTVKPLPRAAQTSSEKRKPWGWIILGVIALGAVASHPWVHAQLSSIQTFF